MAKFYGALEVAQIEWFSDAGRPSASGNRYRVIWNTDFNCIEVSDGTNWRNDVLKFYTSGTKPSASAANQYQVIFLTDTLQIQVSNGTVWTTVGARFNSSTFASLPAASSVQYQSIWVTDLNSLYVSNGTSWIPVGSKAGTKNYFQQSNANPDFETNAISPWAAFTTTLSSGIPTTITTSATQMALSVTSTNPLAGSYTGQLVKSAANAVGQGFISGVMTIDREDLGKVLFGSFAYELVANAANFDASGSSTQSLEIWIYNVTANSWIQPAGYRGINQTSGPGKVVFSFQTDSTAANNQYRVAVLTAQTATTGYTINVDDFQLGPGAMVLGMPASDEASYTPTMVGQGTPTITEFVWSRRGQHLIGRGKYTTGTVTGSAASFTLPNGLVPAAAVPSVAIAGTYMVQTAVGAANKGGALLMAGGSNLITFGSQTTFGSGSSSNISLTAQNGSTIFNTGDTVVVEFCIPIAGWSANVQMSSDTDTRVCAFKAFKGSSVNQTVPGTGVNTEITFNTTVFDTHAGFNGTRFFAPISGYYNIAYAMEVVMGATATASLQAFVLKNGTGAIQCEFFTDALSNSKTYQVSCSGVVYLNAGDYVSVWINSPTQAVTVSSTGGTSENSAFYVNRVTGPSVVAASETVACKYTGAPPTVISGTIAGGNALLGFGTKVYDTHGAYNPSTGLFTAPVTGFYRVACSIVIGGSGTGGYMVNHVNKNGSNDSQSYLVYTGMAQSANPSSIVVTTVYLLAGQTISITAESNFTTPATAGSASTNWLAIEKAS